MKNVVQNLWICCCLFLVSCQVISEDISYVTYDNLTIRESAANDGTFAATIDIGLVGDTFNETLVEEEDYLVSDLLDGLTATLTRVDDNSLTLNVSGSITDHVRCATEPVGFNIYKSALSSGIRAQNTSVDMLISLLGASYAVTGTSLDEAGTNIGTVNDSATFTISGGAIVTADTLVQGTHYELDKDVPDGMTFVATRTSSTTIDFSFNGNATNNESDDSDAFVVEFMQTDASKGTISPFSAEAFCENIAIVAPLTITFVN